MAARTSALLAAALWALSIPTSAQVTPRSADAQANPGATFLALDVFAGGAGYGSKVPEGDGAAKTTTATGWDLGGTVRVGYRWVGITGTLGNGTIASVPTYSVMAGPRFFIGEPGARWIAHTLVGVVGTRGAAPSQTGTQFVAGGGLDLFVLRFQFDYARVNLAALPKNNFRGFIGLVIPTCLRDCRDTDRLCGTGCSFGR
jgi:hypothetical protein